MEFNYFFSNDRKIHLNERFCKIPNIIKFNELMNTNNIAILKSLAKFVKKIFNAVCSSWLMHLYLVICLFVLSTYLYICYMTLTCNDTFIWIFLFVPHVPVIWFWVNKWIELGPGMASLHVFDVFVMKNFYRFDNF